MSLGGVHPYVILKGQRDLMTTNLCKDPEEETNQQPKFSGEMAQRTNLIDNIRKSAGSQGCMCNLFFAGGCPTEGT